LVKEVKPFWKCTSVAKESLDYFEAELRNIIEGIIVNIPYNFNFPYNDIDGRDYGNKPLFSHKRVKKILTEGMVSRYPLIQFKGVDEKLVQLVENKLYLKIKSMASSHPTRGKRFTVR
jgi:hypothetical protein